MEQNKGLVTAALILVVFQLFCFFLPSHAISRTEYRETTVESFSPQQLLVNYADTLDDEDADELWSDCRLGRFFTSLGYLGALIDVVLVLHSENKNKKGNLGLLLSASMEIAAAILINSTALGGIVKTYRGDCTSYMRFGGIMSLLVPPLVLLLFCLHDGSSHPAKKSPKKPYYVVEPNKNTGAIPSGMEVGLKCPRCGVGGQPSNRTCCWSCGAAFEK